LASTSSNGTTNLEYLDDTNRTIIKELQNNPEISQTELAKKVGLSQSSIALRLSKLSESGLVKNLVVVDYSKLGLDIMRVDIVAKDTAPVIEWARSCPLCVNAAKSIGKNNLSLYFLTEDLETISWIIEKHLWKLDGILECSNTPITSWAWSAAPTSYLDLTIQRSDMPPCGVLPFCPKCPSRPNYEGKVWASGSNGTSR
jgi:DNA-binding Lrp family transcriptional regulator